MSTILMCEQTTVTQLYDALRSTNTSDAEILSACRSLTITPARRAALFASLWASGRRDLLKTLTQTLPSFTEPAVLAKAAILLDTPRRTRQQARKVDALTTAGAGRRLRQAQATLATLRTEAVPDAFSASRAFKVVLKKLLGGIAGERLEFDLLFYAGGPWKGLCDLTHTKPADWKIPYFQSVVHGAAAPEGTLLADIETMNKETLPGLLEKHQLLRESFSHIRLKLPASERDERCNSALAEHMPLADALWYYEELRGVESGYGGRISLRGDSKVDEIITRRLEAGELIGGKMKTDNFGKLCERLLTFKQLEKQRHIAAFWQLLMPLADKMLDELKARRLALVRGSGPRTLQELAAGSLHEVGGVDALAAVPEAVVESVPTAPALRVAVLGDASASMQTAINSATIIGAMMSAIFEAELVFFNNKAFKSKIPMPGTTSDVLAVTEEVRANCSTSPAAALYEFYKRKQKIDIFLCVTDEEENTGYDGRSCWGGMGRNSESSFAGLFAKYLTEVHPSAKMSFVSFLRGPTAAGAMVADLKARGIEAAQMRMDGERPDLSKFDGIVGSVMLQAQQQLEAQQGEKREDEQHAASAA